MINESYAIEKSLKLISPLGQYHWRGKTTPWKEYVTNQIGEDFHQGEDGDGCFHTSILLNALAWKYKNKPDELVLDNIKKILSFYELGIEHSGHLIRNLVKLEAYFLFPKQEQHSDKFSFMGLFDNGPQMKYKDVTIDGKTYMMRLDISMDAISNAITGLLYIHKFVKDIDVQNQVKNIVKAQYDYYEKNGWKIKDESGKIVRYGNHKPSLLVPMAIPVKYMMEYALFGKVKKRYVHLDLILNSVFRTFIPGLYKTKETRRQFNNYMFMNAFFAVSYFTDLKSRYKKALIRLIKECRGEMNLFSEAIEAYMANTIIMNKNDRFKLFPKKNKFPLAKKEINVVVPLLDRSGFNLWEESAYEIILETRDLKDDIGYEDYLQAWWLKNS